MDLPCKYSENGCDAEGAKAVMLEHSDSCHFGKIKCPLNVHMMYTCKENLVYCKEILLKNEVINHLSTVHKVAMWKANASGKLTNRSWKILHRHKQMKDITFPVILTSFDGNTFILSSTQQNWTRSIWVAVLGSEKVAKTYDVKIRTYNKGDIKAWIGNIGKVYSTDTSQEDVLEDNKGVLELSKRQMEKLEKEEGDKYKIYIDYEIVRN